MPFGKHKGKAMVDVPAAWLLWLYDENKNKKPYAAYLAPVMAYIVDNLEVLRKELKR